MIGSETLARLFSALMAAFEVMVAPDRISTPSPTVTGRVLPANWAVNSSVEQRWPMPSVSLGVSTAMPSMVLPSSSKSTRTVTSPPKPFADAEGASSGMVTAAAPSAASGLPKLTRLPSAASCFSASSRTAFMAALLAVSTAPEVRVAPDRASNCPPSVVRPTRRPMFSSVRQRAPKPSVSAKSPSPMTACSTSPEGLTPKVTATGPP